MDAGIETNIASLLSTQLTYFLGSPSTFPLRYSNGTTVGTIQAAQLLGYAGAAVAFFFSVSGALQSGSKAITYLEGSFWDFLSDFQKKDFYISMIDDKEKGGKFKQFMEGYAFDTGVLMCVQFWHVFFLIGVGIASAFFILNTTNGYTHSTDVEIY